MLRARQARREATLDEGRVHQLTSHAAYANPEEELQLANSVGLALLVILDTLEPAERLAFVLHDMFAVPFDDVAHILGRSPAAVRQLASRARRRVQGRQTAPDADLARQRKVVDAYLTAAREGNFDALMDLLDPEIVIRGDRRAFPAGVPLESRDRAAIAERAIKAGARAAQPALIDGEVGLVVAPRGRLLLILRFTIKNEKVVEIEAIAEPERLRAINLGVLEP
jgi:RNA polymerase sigma-70 factor (ECF subfamily)